MSSSFNGTGRNIPSPCLMILDSCRTLQCLLVVGTALHISLLASSCLGLTDHAMLQYGWPFSGVLLMNPLSSSWGTSLHSRRLAHHTFGGTGHGCPPPLFLPCSVTCNEPSVRSSTTPSFTGFLPDNCKFTGIHGPCVSVPDLPIFRV